MIERNVSESEIALTLSNPDCISDSDHPGPKKLFRRRSIVVVIDTEEKTLITVWRK